jgi:surface protein
MGEMFTNCKSLASIDPLANWDTSNIAYMDLMFKYCTALSGVSVKKFKSHHAELAAESHSAQPYIPKIQPTDKTPDTAPER